MKHEHSLFPSQWKSLALYMFSPDVCTKCVHPTFYVAQYSRQILASRQMKRPGAGSEAAYPVPEWQ